MNNELIVYKTASVITTTPLVSVMIVTLFLFLTLVITAPESEALSFGYSVR